MREDQRLSTQVMESKNLIYLVTEYADNGELLGRIALLACSKPRVCLVVDLLLREKRLSEAQAKEKFRQLILAVEYIHSRNIVSDLTLLSLSFASVSFRFTVGFFVRDCRGETGAVLQEISKRRIYYWTLREISKWRVNDS